EKINTIKIKIDEFAEKINHLKKERKAKSTALQDELFAQYYFLNRFKEQKNLLQIFSEDLKQNPPSAAGECAAPKLLHYAFKHNLKPIAMAEFWWGQSPKSEIRKHKQFYPACTGKCKPILNHMLKGIEVDDNPMLDNPAENKQLEIIYEDDWIAVINKPAEFLSVPGINISDSVYSRMKERYPNANGPLIVHRLDMSTSGILLVAKDKESHKFLQHQFIKKTITKRYMALLNGIVEKDEGEINLPLRVDLDDRPRQLVCYDYGKPAKTIWKVIHRNNGRTLIHFYPVTGRTHQLRVHASHPLGLNTPIVGDDLYGKKDSRLHLHAERLSFVHPQTKTRVEFTAECEFKNL
ncbi:RluA family pseudouridine synthase, partial [Pseudoxanthomonas sp. SGD-10]